MSIERLRQAREQLRLEFIEYVEDLATGGSDEIEHIVNLRHAIDALDHAIKNGWDREPPSQPPLSQSSTWMEADQLPGDERG